VPPAFGSQLKKHWSVPSSTAQNSRFPTRPVVGIPVRRSPRVSTQKKNASLALPLGEEDSSQSGGLGIFPPNPQYFNKNPLLLPQPIPHRLRFNILSNLVRASTISLPMYMSGPLQNHCVLGFKLTSPLGGLDRLWSQPHLAEDLAESKIFFFFGV
jgi:hypothetical protein